MSRRAPLTVLRNVDHETVEDFAVIAAFPRVRASVDSGAAATATTDGAEKK